MKRPGRYRRSPYIALLWADDRPQLANYRLRRVVPCTPTLLQVLEFLGKWRRATDVAVHFGTTAAAAEKLMTLLVSKGLVNSDSTIGNAAPDPWAGFGPLAEALHFGSRDTVFPLDPVSAEKEYLRKEAKQRPPSRTTRRGTRIKLEAPVATTVGAQLLQRRTWRAFGEGKISRSKLDTLLGVTFGVQIRARSMNGRPMALKTSPSGGARHPIEAYVALNGVEGTAPGLYHVDGWRKALIRLETPLPAGHGQRYFPSQPWFWNAHVIVFMTAVLARTSSRYPSPRAYRNIFLEAGHLAQSFCLLATELQLAPFTTHAIADSAIDSDLGLDGVHEGVVYVAGCGSRPSGGWTSNIPGLTSEVS